MLVAVHTGSEVIPNVAVQKMSPKGLPEQATGPLIPQMRSKLRGVSSTLESLLPGHELGQSCGGLYLFLDVEEGWSQDP